MIRRLMSDGGPAVGGPADVLVAGGGNAGLVAALEARAASASATGRRWSHWRLAPKESPSVWHGMEGVKPSTPAPWLWPRAASRRTWNGWSAIGARARATT